MRVSERSKVTSSSILFRFNCSWFSDANGAVRYFAVIVAESDGRQAAKGRGGWPRPQVRSSCDRDTRLTVLRLFVLFSFAAAATETLQPELRHPLPSHRDYAANSSVRAYQTAYFSSRCPQDADAAAAGAPQVVEVNLGAGSERLGGACDRYHDDDGHLYLSDSYGGFCDGPLKAKTSYRYTDTHTGTHTQS